MVRKILGVIIGYLVMVIFMAICFLGGFLLLTPERAMEPNSFVPSTLWIIISFIISLLGALIGGFLCKLISRSSGTVLIFAGIIFVSGLVLAFTYLALPKPDDIRTVNFPAIEAFARGVQPVWVAFVNPIIGAFGIIMGGSFKKTD